MTQIRIDLDVLQLVRRLQAQEFERGNPGLSDVRAVNWLAREGARAMGLATPVAKKATL